MITQIVYTRDYCRIAIFADFYYERSINKINLIMRTSSINRLGGGICLKSVCDYSLLSLWLGCVVALSIVALHVLVNVCLLIHLEIKITIILHSLVW